MRIPESQLQNERFKALLPVFQSMARYHYHQFLNMDLTIDAIEKSLADTLQNGIKK